MRKIVTKREVLVKKPNGEMFNTSIQFGMPYENDRHGWCCDLMMDGIDEFHYGAGMDSLQALMLTMSLAESILITRTNNGWCFYWPDTKEPMEIREMFNLSSFLSYKK